MKEEGDLPGLRVDSCQVWAIVQITAVACQRQITGLIEVAVLLRQDMFKCRTRSRMAASIGY